MLLAHQSLPFYSFIRRGMRPRAAGQHIAQSKKYRCMCNELNWQTVASPTASLTVTLALHLIPKRSAPNSCGTRSYTWNHIHGSHGLGSDEDCSPEPMFLHICEDEKLERNGRTQQSSDCGCIELKTRARVQ